MLPNVVSGIENFNHSIQIEFKNLQIWVDLCLNPTNLRPCVIYTMPDQSTTLKMVSKFWLRYVCLFGWDLMASSDNVNNALQNKALFKTPIHLEVTAASEEAIKQIEAVGGTVTAVHFNKLALRALLKPTEFSLLPLRARPPPKIMPFYLDRTKSGYLAPEIQIRNLKMFGALSSEEAMQIEHANFMQMQRRIAATQR